MFNIKKNLELLESNGVSINVALLGSGKMGASLAKQLYDLAGMTPSIIINRTPSKGIENLKNAGIPENEIIEISTEEELSQAILNKKVAVASNFEIALDNDFIDVIVDATGDPEFGAIVAVKSIEAKKHIVLLNVECDAVVGPILRKKALENNVIYTGSKGDEPGAIIELMEFVESIGAELVAVGKGKNNKLDNYATQDDLREDAISRGLNPRMLTSFVDGTNTMIELNAVCNATGFLPDVEGCHGITTTSKEAAKVFSLKEEGGILNKNKIVDFAFGMAPGVFAIVRSDNEQTRELLSYLGLGEGPNFCIFRPYHLTSLETPITIYKAMVDNETSIEPECGMVADTIAIAKRDSKAGDLVGGIGSDVVYGKLVAHTKQQTENLLPIALITPKTKFLVDVKKDTRITMEMVELDEESMLTILRKEQDELGL